MEKLELLLKKINIEDNQKEYFKNGKLEKIICILKEEKIIKHNGFSLTFVVDLSHQLMDYDLLDKEYYSIDRLVSDLWK